MMTSPRSSRRSWSSTWASSASPSSSTDIHAADASPWNPAAYWTTISPSTAFAFRIAGGAFLTLILGPFLDEIFGGVGVLMKAFTRQCLIFNFIAFFLFLYFSFYAPLDDAIPFIWKGQTIFAGFVLAWSIIEAIPLQYLPGSYVLFNVLMYSGFGVGLTAIPDLAFGPPSPVAYWNEWGPLDVLTGRSLGLSLLILITLGAVYASGPGYCKQVTAFNLINTGLFVLPAFYGGSSAVTSMWLIQFVFTVPIVLVGIYLELVGATGTWAPAFSCPACGLNVESFNMFNLFFYLPFAAGFLSPYANLMFGPNTPTGFPMFNQEFGETALWFTKAWATCVLLLTLGPYLFSLSPVKTAKQIGARVHRLHRPLHLHSRHDRPLQHGHDGTAHRPQCRPRDRRRLRVGQLVGGPPLRVRRRRASQPNARERRQDARRGAPPCGRRRRERR